MNIKQYRDIKRMQRKGSKEDKMISLYPETLGALLNMIDEHREFTKHLLAYSTSGSTSKIKTLYDVRDWATKLLNHVEGDH